MLGIKAAKPGITARKCIINQFGIGNIFRVLFLYLYFIAYNNAHHDISQQFEVHFVFIVSITLYMQMIHYSLEKLFANLINFLPYLNLMKCHLPFKLHISYNKATNITKN